MTAAPPKSGSERLEATALDAARRSTAPELRTTAVQGLRHGISGSQIEYPELAWIGREQGAVTHVCVAGDGGGGGSPMLGPYWFHVSSRVGAQRHGETFAQNQGATSNVCFMGDVLYGTKMVNG